MAKAMGITLSTSIDPIMNELNAIKNTSQDIINSVDAHRAKIEACESILEDINPAFKQTREVEAEAEAGVLMGRTWGTVVVFTTITVCMRR